MLLILKVMINILCMCTVWGEPLSQTAQSFMPELIYGVNRNLNKVLNRMPFCSCLTVFVNITILAYLKRTIYFSINMHAGTVFFLKRII